MAHLDHKDAFEDFKSRVLDGIGEHFPVRGREQTLELEGLTVKDTALHEDDIRAQHKAKLEGKSWSAPVYAQLKLVNHNTGKVVERKKIRVADIPMSTRRYSYIVDGQEYQVDNQWQLKPGVYTKRARSGELQAKFNVPNKQSFDVNFDPEKQIFHMERGKTKKIPVYPLLKSLGVDDDTLEKQWGKDVLAANKEAGKSHIAALSKFFKSDRKRPPKDLEEAENYFIDTMTQSELRPDSTEATLGKPMSFIDGETFIRATTKMLNVLQDKEKPDDRDSLQFKDLRSVGDFAFDKLTSHRTKQSIKHKMLRQINSASGVRDIVRSGTFGKPLKDTFSNNSAANVAAQINPVEMIASSMQTTIMGPGGIQSSNAINDEAKLVNDSHFGFLDPIHTPESEKTGVTLHLPVGVRKKGKAALIPVHNLKTGKVEDISVKDFMSSNVALPDQVEWESGKPKFISKTVKMSGVGNKLRSGKASDAQYVMKHPSQMFSITSNLIPFMGSNSGNRASYATQHIEQAISLRDREAPLVQTATGTDKEGMRSFEELLGRHTSHISPTDGTVVKMKKDGIIIKGEDGKNREVQLYNNFPLNDPKSVLDSTAIEGIKPGTKVKKGQSIADTNFTKKGKLALGTNLNVAYLPFKGYNFEDGVVISETAAEKLSSVHMHKPAVVIDKETVTNPTKFARQHVEAFTKNQYKNVGGDGVVKVGTRVAPGDPLVLATRPYQLKDKTGRNAIRKSTTGVHTDMSLKWDSDYQGEVVGANRSKKGEVTVHVKTIEPMQVGDKLTGRHGNKGIVTQVLPDKYMPQVKGKKGKDAHIEVALNPAGVPGRMNVGQVLETAASKIARKTGKTYIVENFGKEEDQLAKVRSDLKAHGFNDDGTEELIDPQTGVSLGRALSGPQYMLKLTHQIDKKISARSGMSVPGTEAEGYDFNLMPAGGGKTGGQSMGNLGLYAMLAHGAKANIREMHTWKSEGPDSAPEHKQWRSQHNEVWNQIQSNEAYPTPKSTFSFEKFTSMLNAAGVDVTKKGNRMQLTPLTDKQILGMSQGVLTKPSALTTAKIDSNGDPTPVKNGLFDPKITGGHGGKKWSHFELAEPMPNPVFEGAIKKVLGLTKNQYESIILSDKAIDPKSGKVVTLAAKGSLTGGPAISHMLKKLDIKKELKKASTQLDDINVSLKPGSLTYNKKGQPKNTQKLDSAVKKVKYLRALQETGMSAEEAYTLKNVPIIPPAMRPASMLPDGSVKWADLNGLYAELASLNEQMKDPRYKDVLSDKVKKESRAGLYDGVKALMGVGSSYTDRQDKNKGLLLQISGSQPKKGYFQSKLLNRRQDLTMRSTIVPEPAMGLDDVGLPTKKAMTLFRPFVVKKLQDLGAAQNPLDAQKLLDEKRSHKDKQVLRALDLVMEERPVMMKRDPVLHKHGVQAFNAHRVPGRAIQIHPLVTGGYNADFDGDQMSVYVPIHPEAVKEARKMVPSNNLFNEATGRINNVPTLESALGLFKLSRMKGTAKKTMKEAAVIKAVEGGKLGINDRVKVPGIGTTTAGRLMLSTALPEGSKMRKKVLTDAKFELDKKGLPDLYTHLARDYRGDFGEAANRLKDLGFDTAFGAVRVPHPDHKGQKAIDVAENPSKSIKYLPVGTHSLSLADFTPDKKTRDRVVASTQRRVDMINSSDMKQDAKDLRAVEEWTKATKRINNTHFKAAEKNPDNLFLMLKAGVKPNPEQYQQIKIAPMLMEDSTGKTLPTPVTKSYAEGLDLAGYWTQMHGARKGSVQKVQEVRAPGFFSKQLINTTMGLQINGRDCKTDRGVALGIGSEEVYDRELAAAIKVKKRTFPVGTRMTPDVIAQIRSADPKARVAVRSPLKCEHAEGLCQKCAGISPNGRHYDLGTNMGILSAQSLGERAMQLTLKSFHSGGVAGAGGKLLGSFERVNQLTRLPKTIPDASALSMKSGTVEKIEHGKTGSDVWIGGQKHFVPLDRAGRKLTDAVPALQKLDGGKKWSSLRVGQRVDAGQTLSDPNRTAVNPHDLYRATKSIEKVQNHMTNELHSIFGAEGVRRQHVETVVKAMSNLTRVKHPGSSTSVLKGEYQSRAAMAAKNRKYARQGRQPIVHEPILKGIDVIPLAVQDDWMAKLNFERLSDSVQEGAATAAYSDLHGPNPIPGMAYAAEFGMTKKHKRMYPHLKDKPEFGY